MGVVYPWIEPPLDTRSKSDIDTEVQILDIFNIPRNGASIPAKSTQYCAFLLVCRVIYMLYGNISGQKVWKWLHFLQVSKVSHSIETETIEHPGMKYLSCQPSTTLNGRLYSKRNEHKAIIIIIIIIRAYLD